MKIWEKVQYYLEAIVYLDDYLFSEFVSVYGIDGFHFNFSFKTRENFR